MSFLFAMQHYATSFFENLEVTGRLITAQRLSRKGCMDRIDWRIKIFDPSPKFSFECFGVFFGFYLVSYSLLSRFFARDKAFPDKVASPNWEMEDLG